MPTRFSRSIKAHLLRHSINEQVTRRVRPASCNACRQVTQLEAVDDAGGKSDRKSTRLNSSHLVISYAVFCLKKKKKKKQKKTNHTNNQYKNINKKKYNCNLSTLSIEKKRRTCTLYSRI